MQDLLTMPSSAALELEERVSQINTMAESAGRFPFRAVRKILLPFDLSRAGVCALRVVSDLAEKTGATIHLVHVVRPSETQGIEPLASRADDTVAEATERLLKLWTKRIVEDRARTFVSIRIGEPVDVIVARAIATGADLIVMTSRSSFGHSLEPQRSTAERVSRLAPCPVLTIPERCRERMAYEQRSLTANWKTILVPVDFTAVASEALRFAGRIAKETGSTLLLAHGCDTEHNDEGLVRMRLKTLTSDLVDEAVPCHFVIWPGGHSLYAILSETLRSEANLIVLPTGGQSWARRLRAGSITDGVLRQAPCPVISINEKFSQVDE